MPKVKSNTRANPQNISCRTDSTSATTSVTVNRRLCQNERINRAIVYQRAIVKSPINGKYNPGIKISLRSAGSTYIII